MDGIKNLRLIKRIEVESRTGLGRSSMYEQIKEEQFPKPIKIGQRSVAWIESEIDDWIKEKINSQRSRLETLKAIILGQSIEISARKDQETGSSEQSFLKLSSKKNQLEIDRDSE